MKKNKKGFTLVELVIVVAVMAVLVAVAIPTVTSITKTAKETVADTNARTIESTLKLAEAEKNKEGDADSFTALGETEIEDALEAAKLGITSGIFKYDSALGTVVAEHEMESVPAASSIPVGTYYIVYSNGTADATTYQEAAGGEGADEGNTP